ncbi:MAG: hypothetical protein HOB22_05960, partial [Candidatus Marinimicrobia bacterium]|nr:hypothetical protein [Candidatus Neomarinimicrobiota bacterium]
MKYLQNLVISLLVCTFAFAVNTKDNPKKAGKENSFRLNSKKFIEKPARVKIQKEIKSVNDFIDNDQFRPQVETNPYIDPRDAEFEALNHPEAPVRNADYISTVDKLKNGTVSIENLISDLVPSSRTTPDFPEYTVCSDGCDYDDLATAIASVPNQSTIFITEPGEYVVIGSEIIDRSIWIKGLSPEETIITGALDLEDIPEGLIYFEKENYADWSLEENQDRIKNDIWITRGNDSPIFNAAVETYDYADDYEDVVPTNTLWAQGRTADVDSIDYEPFRPMTGTCPPCIVGLPLSLQTYGSTYERPDSVVYFEKEDYADWSLEENQDRITDGVWITRGDYRAIFNAAVENWYSLESSYTPVSPIGTRWAIGRTDTVDASDYRTFALATGWNPPDLVNEVVSMEITNWDSYVKPDSVVYFEKEDVTADTLAENQDRVADSVWITRGNYGGWLFNAATENLSSGNSPEGTMWAFGRTADVDSTEYGYFGELRDSVGGYMPALIGHVLSLKVTNILVDSSVTYYDVVIKNWSSGGDADSTNGRGGFSYYRGAPGAHLPTPDVLENQYFDVEFTKWTQGDGSGGSNGGGFAYYRGAPGAFLPSDAPMETDFFDVVFTKWTQGGNGGGFAYYRGEPGADLPSMGTMFTIADTTADNDPVYVRFSDLTIANGSGSETAGAIQVNSPDTSETTTIELDNI